MKPSEIPDFDSDFYDPIPFEIEFVDGEAKGTTTMHPSKVTTVQIHLHSDIHDEDPDQVEYSVYPYAVGIKEGKIIRVYAFGATDDEACKRHIEAIRLREQADFLDQLNAL